MSKHARIPPGRGSKIHFNGVAHSRDGERAERASSAASAAAPRVRKRAAVAREGDGPDPREELLRAALGGDEHAAWRAEQLYGRRWRDQVREEASDVDDGA